jgi:hypothetical protein
MNDKDPAMRWDLEELGGGIAIATPPNTRLTEGAPSCRARAGWFQSLNAEPVLQQTGHAKDGCTSATALPA